MRSTSKKKMQVASALAAAAFGGWLAVPVAQAGFNVTVTGPIAITGSTNQEYVVSATNLGAAPGEFPATGNAGAFAPENSGSELVGVDATITTTGGKDLVIDIVDVNGDGLPDADIDGSLPPATYYNNQVAPPQPSFGATSLGSNKAYTFISIGNKVYVPGQKSNFPTATLAATKVYINQFTAPNNPVNPPIAVNLSTSSDFGGGGGTVATAPPAAPPFVDPNFLNGTVTALEVNAAGDNGGPVATAGAGIPFANIVVPAGTSGTVIGQLAGDINYGADFTVNFGATATSVATTLSLTTAASFTNIGTVSISGHNGSYVPQTISTGANTIKGSLEVTGFTSGDEEVYALTAAPGTGETLAALIAELNTDVSGTNAGATAEAITPTIANLFPSADIEVDIPNAGTGSTPAFLNYDLSEDSTGPTISAIGVVPEPTGIGFLVVSGLGLLARRRRAMQA
ncbi:MAG: hypothetical protein ABSH22_02425 [Tepidisphaeraceae bacterium]